MHINANVKIQIYKSQLSKKRVYITWTCLIVEIVKIDYYKCVFVLFPVVELSQRLNVGKSQPDIIKQKSMDYAVWLDLKSLQLLHKDVYSAAKLRCKILIMTLTEIGE